MRSASVVRVTVPVREPPEKRVDWLLTEMTPVMDARAMPLAASQRAYSRYTPGACPLAR